MHDDGLYPASLRVVSAILTGLASALLIEIPLTVSWGGLTENTIFCILATSIAIQIERYLYLYDKH